MLGGGPRRLNSLLDVVEQGVRRARSCYSTTAMKGASATTAGGLDRAVALHAKAENLREAGDHKRAAVAARGALRLFERYEGRRHPDVAAALLELGRARELGDAWGEALGYYRRANTILRRFARLQNPDIRRLRVKSERALCGVYRALGRYPLGDRHGRLAVDLAERYFGARDLDLAGALNDVGMLRKYQGRYAEAPPLYRRSLAIVRRAGLGDSADAASIYHNLGGIEHARGRYARAEVPARRAVVLRTRALGARHPSVAADVAALAAIVEGRGRLTEAARLYRRALTIFRRAFGPRSYEVGINLAGLAGICANQGRAALAERLYRQSHAIHLRLFGPHHIEVALTLNNLAMLVSARGRRPEALRIARQALSAFQTACGPQHPHTRACAKNVAQLLEIATSIAVPATSRSFDRNR